jgi:hypothetical protein
MRPTANSTADAGNGVAIKVPNEPLTIFPSFSFPKISRHWLLANELKPGGAVLFRRSRAFGRFTLLKAFPDGSVNDIRKLEGDVRLIGGPVTVVNAVKLSIPPIEGLFVITTPLDPRRYEAE